LLFIAAIAESCATQSQRAENVFDIKGKNFVLSRESLEEFRRAWDTGGVTIGPSRTALSAEDQRWTLDLISILEGAGQHQCKKLRLTSIEQLKDKPML